MPSRRSSPRPTGEATRKRRAVHPESHPCRRTSHAPVRSPVGSRAGTRSRSNQTATRSAPPSRISSSSSAAPPDRLSRLQFVCFICKQDLLDREYELFAALPLFILFSFPPNEFYIRVKSRASPKISLGGMVLLFTLFESRGIQTRKKSRRKSCGITDLIERCYYFFSSPTVFLHAVK